MQQFQPVTKILGAYRKKFEAHDQIIERMGDDGVPIQDTIHVEEETKWVKPTPQSFDRHFKNAAARKLFEALPAERQNASDAEAKRYLKMVPIYGGLACCTLKQLLQNHKYHQKLISPEWTAGRAQRSGAMTADNEPLVKNPQHSAVILGDAALSRIATGEPFTLKDITAIIGSENRADKIIQRLRKQGKITFKREGNKAIWSLTAKGRDGFDNTFKDA